jgi:aspartyl-tRNA(Asn)/glutamyl-tRNA(Gln) amidotransferase subunit A
VTSCRERRTVGSMLTRRDLVLGAASSSLFVRAGLGQAQVATDLTSLSLEEASQLIRSCRISALDLTNACLARIHTYEPLLNAFITITEDYARDRATMLDLELRRGRWRGPLHGIPIALKDNMDLAGYRTTAASAVRRNSSPAPVDAEVVRRLKQAGAVILGKTNMIEFAAFGPSTDAYGRVHNPWSLDRTPGGSSSGAGAAVSARLCFGAIGTDTGGSIRSPAGVCGITGLKTSYGRVSNRGIIPFNWSLDTVGPLARSATDAAILLQAMAGYDRLDSSSGDHPVPDYRREIAGSVRGLRVGVVRVPYFDDLKPEIAPAIYQALRDITAITPQVREVSLPYVDPDMFAVLQLAEAYAYHRSDFERAPELYGPLLRNRLKMGKALTAAEYAAARHQLDELRRAIQTTFEDVDLVVTPNRAVSEKLADLRPADTSTLPIATRVRNTSQPMSAFGIPAASVPCGFARNGLPVGMQIAGPIWGEGRVLALARAYQERTSWHLAAPAFSPSVGFNLVREEQQSSG